MKRLFVWLCLASALCVQAAEQISIAQFINYADEYTTYRLRGVVTSIQNTYYGNLYLEDETGSIYVYGVSNFQSYDILVDDTLTIEGTYKLYGTKHECYQATYINHVHPGTTPDTPDPDPTKTEVDFATDFAGGWSPWVGKTLTFTNDFYVNDTYGPEISYIRLRSPEEYGDEGTTAYTNAETHNSWATCSLSGVYLRSGARPGTIIRGLKARVTSANNLQAVETPTIIYNELPTQRPDLGNANVVVCGTNIENFFVTLGGYAGASNETQLNYQKQKISNGLYHINADVYAICEMEQGDRAVPVMVAAMNNLAGADVYDWVNAGFPYADAVMVCFIYRKDKMAPVGNYMSPYSSGTYYYREGIQGFKHLASGEKFVVSINHFKAKSSSYDTDGTRQQNMRNLISKLPDAAAIDPDILVMGDLNAYTNEESNLLLSRDKGYVDLLMRDDPMGYSYVYQNLVGYLDHAYCSPSMAPQVTKAVPYHLNADTQKSYEYSYGNTTMYRYSDHDPILVGLHLGGEDTPSAIDNESTAVNPQKLMRNGQIIIIRSGVEYTITGARLK